MSIMQIPVAVNRNAPVGSNAIYVYDTDKAKGLTLGQLMSSVCLRMVALHEARSVTQMNSMNAFNDDLRLLSEKLQLIAEEKLSADDWTALRNDTLSQPPFGIDGLPTSITTYDDRMLAMTKIKEAMDRLTQSSQEVAIDLQTSVSRRDVALTTATNLIHAMGQSMQNSVAR